MSVVPYIASVYSLILPILDKRIVPIDNHTPTHPHEFLWEVACWWLITDAIIPWAMDVKPPLPFPWLPDTKALTRSGSRIGDGLRYTRDIYTDSKSYFFKQSHH